jgi:hypothetical protein
MLALAVRSSFRSSFVFAAASSLAGVAAAQQVRWVDPVLGNDGNAGSYTAPLRTIGAAVASSGPGDEVRLLAGTYGPNANGEALPITLGTVPQQGLVLRGIGTVVLDLASSQQSAFRLVNGADGCRITNLTITNSDRTNWWTRAINSGTGVNTGNAAANVEIDRCRFTSLNRGLVLWTSDNVQGWRVHDNLFFDCANDAILEYAGDNDVYNNTFVQGTWKAYISDSTTSRCWNNLVVNYAIAFENNAASNNPARYQDNWIWQCGVVAQGAGLAAGLPASNVASIDPQLTNLAGGDYHPLPTSPLRDNGNVATVARADLDGVARAVDSDLNGSVVADIGCFEASPIRTQASWLVPQQVLQIDQTSAVAGSIGVVLFAFGDGVIPIPGEGPILLDPLTTQGFYLAGVLPQTWFLSFTGVAIPPGLPLVMHGVALVPGTPRIVGGNQVWFQL